MSYKYELSSKYTNFKSDLLNIQSIFDANNDTIHQARNELKIINFGTVNAVVKAYKIPNIINQFVYAYIRKSKPYKAFHNALKLQELGINTPEAIAYIEFHRMGMLKESFFISKYYKYSFTMAHIRDEQPDYKEDVLKEFAKFTYNLHAKGVWHSDYSGGNILIEKKDSEYIFSIVDINRMKFFPIKGYKGLENFNKLWLNEKDLIVIAKEYAKIALLDEEEAIRKILYYDKKLKNKVQLKRKMLGKN